MVRAERRGSLVGLERLGYGAESRQKIVRSNPSFVIRRLENSVSPAVNEDHFSNQGRIRQRKKRDEQHLSSVLPKVSWLLIPSLLGYWELSAFKDKGPTSLLTGQCE